MIAAIRRYRADDDAPETIAGYLGGLADLTSDLEDDDTGLVDVTGTPIRRPSPPARKLGFQPDRACRE